MDKSGGYQEYEFVAEFHDSAGTATPVSVS